VDIPESNIGKGAKAFPNLRYGVEELEGFVHGHRKNVGDVLPAKVNFEGLPIVPLPPAEIARDIDIGEKVHLDLHNPVARAGLATTSLHIEGEPPGLVPTHLCLGELGEELPDRREHTGIGGRIRPGSPADRGLIDIDHLIDQIEPLDSVVLEGEDLRPVEVAGQLAIESLVDQCRLP
jgi:hypothetical protein